MRKLTISLLWMSIIASLASCGKKNEQPQAGPKAVPKEVTTHCGSHLSVEDSSSIKTDSISDAVLTKYFYVTASGVKYPIYMKKTGKCFIIRTSTKTGKQYRQYLPEISKQYSHKEVK